MYNITFGIGYYLMYRVATSKATPPHYGQKGIQKGAIIHWKKFADLQIFLISFSHCARVDWRHQFVNRLSETIWPDFLMPIIRQHRSSFEVMVKIYYTMTIMNFK